MQRTPTADAPNSIETDETSLSPCTNTPPTSGSLLDMYSGSSFCGVIG